MNTLLPGIRGEPFDGSPLGGASEHEREPKISVAAQAKPAIEREPGRRTPMSDVPFQPGWRDVEKIPMRKDCTSPRLEWDTGCRTEVNLEIKPWDGRWTGSVVELECGHAKISEIIEIADLEPLDDVTAVRMVLAHHAMMCACHCIRPLWNLFYELPLTTYSSDQAVRKARRVIIDQACDVRVTFEEHVGPPARRWVVKPEETWHEREGDWPDWDEFDWDTGRRMSADMVVPGAEDGPTTDDGRNETPNVA